MRLNGPFINIHKSNYFIILVLIKCFTIGSALSIIYVKHKSRMLHVLLQNIHLERSRLNTEWSKLVLEKSTLMTDVRIEQTAKQSLGMAMPDQVELIGSS